MQHQSDIQPPSLQFGIFFIGTEHHQQILGSAEFTVRSVNIHTVIIVEMVVSMISVYGQHGKYTDQSDALTQNILYRSIAAVLVIGCQSQNALGHGIHDIFRHLG